MNKRKYNLIDDSEEDNFPLGFSSSIHDCGFILDSCNESNNLDDFTWTPNSSLNDNHINIGSIYDPPQIINKPNEITSSMTQIEKLNLIKENYQCLLNVLSKRCVDVDIIPHIKSINSLESINQSLQLKEKYKGYIPDDVFKSVIEFIYDKGTICSLLNTSRSFRYTTLSYLKYLDFGRLNCEQFKLFPWSTLKTLCLHSFKIEWNYRNRARLLEQVKILNPKTLHLIFKGNMRMPKKLHGLVVSKLIITGAVMELLDIDMFLTTCDMLVLNECTIRSSSTPHIFENQNVFGKKCLLMCDKVKIKVPMMRSGIFPALSKLFGSMFVVKLVGDDDSYINNLVCISNRKNPPQKKLKNIIHAMNNNEILNIYQDNGILKHDQYNISRAKKIYLGRLYAMIDK